MGKSYTRDLPAKIEPQSIQSVAITLPKSSNNNHNPTKTSKIQPQHAIVSHVIPLDLVSGDTVKAF